MVRDPLDGSLILPVIFAASIVGGFGSIYGALIGGYLMGMSEMLISNYLATIIGPEVLSYSKAIPLIALAVALLLCPKGLVSIIPEIVVKIKKVTRT